MFHILNTIAAIIGWFSILCTTAIVGGILVSQQQEKHVAKKSKKEFDEITKDIHADTD